ncbi:MAG: FG-GAP repeat protein [Phycisphaerales bacterium]|nr:FG-GAP repeat protein [Phycisphaerales bacterium]
MWIRSTFVSLIAAATLSAPTIAQRCGPFQLFDARNRDGYGRAVAVKGDVAVVGTPSFNTKGSASVYRWNGVSWVFEQELAGPPLTNGTVDAFGSSVAISGNTIVVGAAEQDIAFSNQGAVHVFVHNGSSWVLQSQLTAPDAAATDNFGGSVAIDGNTGRICAAG